MAIRESATCFYVVHADSLLLFTGFLLMVPNTQKSECRCYNGNFIFSYISIMGLNAVLTNCYIGFGHCHNRIRIFPINLKVGSHATCNGALSTSIFT